MSSSFDTILDKIGQFGPYQIKYWLLASISILPGGFNNLLNAYLEATPDFRCRDSNIEPLNLTGTNRTWYDKSCSVEPDFGLGNATTTVSPEPPPCTEFEYDYTLYGTTAVTKWDLVCSKSILPALAQSLYMVGFLFGAFIVGYISDRFGRRPALMLSLGAVAAFGVASSFVPCYSGHVVFRMVAGMGAAGCCTSSFVIFMEIIGRDRRLGPGAATQVFFALGYMLLAGVAFLLRDFTWTNFTMSLLPVIMLSYSWIIPESPRWQLTHGQVEEAKAELKRAARTNKTDANIDELIEECQRLNSLEEKTRQSNERTYTILDLVRTPVIRRVALNMSFTWFCSGMMYYGLSMGVTELSGDPYMNMFLSGVMECTAAVVTFFLLDRIGRRLSQTGTLVVGGVACIICGLLPQRYSMAIRILSLIGKLGVGGTATVIYIYSAELYPTVVRTIGVGAGSISARLGALLAPFVGQLSSVWSSLPTLIFGIGALLAGIWSLWLPETLERHLPETLEDMESLTRNQKMFSCHKSPPVPEPTTDQEAMPTDKKSSVC